MHLPRRPARREWLSGLAAGAGLGFLFLGIGARAGMRVIALASGQPAVFTVEGTIAVSVLGALTGALVAAIFLLVRAAFPAHRWVRGVLFWTVCAAVVLRGLHPVTIVNAAVFLPLFLVHGALLHVYWCRVHLPRVRHADPAGPAGDAVDGMATV
jgi:hypothetical protein